MKGRLVDLTFGLNRKQRITVEVDRDFRREFEQLKESELSIEIKKHRNRRSLDANAYAWVLVDKLAEALSLEKAAVYKAAIRNIGGVSEIICVKEEAVEKLRSAWESNGIGWQTLTMPSKIAGCVNVILYYGSSTYDTKQMSQLIDFLVYEAQDLGIETATPEQLARYKEEWRRSNAERNTDSRPDDTRPGA